MAKSWLTRAYNFIDKDPAIDEFRTIWQKEHIKESDLAVLAGLSATTVKNMFGGETRRPQHATLAKMAGAMNYEYGLRRMQPGPDYANEIPKARDEWKAHKEALKRRRDRAAKRAKNGGA
jgi:transcriptional regulator with XRE-family HTH domain